mmetsp:Transcript_21550/g.33718  ORF Transcript_21550/g.33718 Transcript_21550/m.33718 type:complete len:89 (+) Transcript_21550:242-508(+)
MPRPNSQVRCTCVDSGQRLNLSSTRKPSAFSPPAANAPSPLCIPGAKVRIFAHRTRKLRVARCVGGLASSGGADRWDVQDRYVRPVYP